MEATELVMEATALVCTAQVYTAQDSTAQASTAARFTADTRRSPSTRHTLTHRDTHTHTNRTEGSVDIPASEATQVSVTAQASVMDHRTWEALTLAVSEVLTSVHLIMVAWSTKPRLSPQTSDFPTHRLESKPNFLYVNSFPSSNLFMFIISYFFL